MRKNIVAGAALGVVPAVPGVPVDVRAVGLVGRPARGESGLVPALGDVKIYNSQGKRGLSVFSNSELERILTLTCFMFFLTFL